MKRNIIMSLFVFLLITFVSFYWTFPVFAEEGDNKYGGIFKIAFYKPAMNFGNPLRMQGPDKFYADFCLQRLIQPGNKVGEFEPLLATSWELSPDAKSYIFRLRKGVKFHDGTVFNAQAVKWNLDRVLNTTRSTKKGKPPGPPQDQDAALKGGPPGGPPGKGRPPGPPPGGPNLPNVTSIDIVDDHTVKLYLSSWDNLVLRDLGFANSCFLVSPTAFEKNGEKWSNTHPVGTGPFKFKAYKRNLYLKYERFDKYWESGLPYLDGVEIHNIRDQMTSIASLKVGEVHALNEIDIVTAGELAADERFEISGITGLRIFIVANTNDPNSVWADKRMREALEYAIDKEAITKNVGRGYSKPFYSIIPGVSDKSVTSARQYNPGKARQLIQEAGHPQGVECTLSFFAEGPRDFWVALQENLSEVGIKVKLNPLNRPALMSIMFQGVKGNDLRMGVMEDHPDPFLVLESHISPKSVLYKELKRPPELVQLIDQVIVERDADKQIELFKRMENIAYNSISYIPLWSEPFMRVFDKNLKDYIAYFNETNELRLNRAWLEKK